MSEDARAIWIPLGHALKNDDCMYPCDIERHQLSSHQHMGSQIEIMRRSLLQGIVKQTVQSQGFARILVRKQSVVQVALRLEMTPSLCNSRASKCFTGRRRNVLLLWQTCKPATLEVVFVDAYSLYGDVAEMSRLTVFSCLFLSKSVAKLCL